MKSAKEPTVGIIMGSKSDWGVMKNTCDIFNLPEFKNVKKLDLSIFSEHCFSDLLKPPGII